jgi:hypothetical protein
MECRHFPDRDPSNNRLENLSWGTHKQNEADKQHHGTRTVLRGEKNGRAKLTEDDVTWIRLMHNSGWTLKEIAARYGVHFGTIHLISTGKRWKHLLE